MIDRPFFINSENSLSKAIDDFSQHDLLAIDTELDSYYAYNGRICLVQISTSKHDYVLDPLAVDVSKLAPLFADKERIAIFHAGTNDIPHLRHEFGIQFSHIFDTYLASGMLKLEQRGLAGLLNHYFGITLDKACQRADWSRRPLSEQMLQYARYDTRYLIQLRDVMIAELEHANLLKSAEFAFANILKTPYTPKVFNPHGWAKVKGVRNLLPSRRGIVREVYSWRDTKAQRLNLQPFRVMPDFIIIKLAMAPPKTMQDLRRNHDVRILETHPESAQSLFAAIQKGAKLGAVPWPTLRPENRFTPEQLKRFKNLKDWRQEIMQKENETADTLFSSKALAELVKLNPQDLQALANTELLFPNVLEKYGADILQILQQD